ncbi:MAG: class I SAM-dependent methyltransferase [Bacteroidota bacterium]|nr:class I SAM-dependent methyltransferase [Bacteroidota bacterium]
MQDDKLLITKDYYDKRFGDLSQNLNEEEQLRWNVLSNFISRLNLKKNSNIADFGCGRGWLSNKLTAFGNVVGFDVSELAVENAKKSFRGTNFICLDASQPIPKNYFESFDLIVSSEVIEHIEEQGNYLKNIQLLLKKDGLFIITTPNSAWKNAFYNNGRETWKQPIENWRTAEELNQLCLSVHLNKISVTSFNSEWIFAFKPAIKIKWVSNTLIRKLLKATKFYDFFIKRLNKKMYGINLLFFGKKS